MCLNKKISIAIASALLLVPAVVFAATANPEDKAGNYNMALIGLVSLMLILLFVIGMLAYILRQLSFAVSNKMRKDKQQNSAVAKQAVLILLFSMMALGVHAAQIAAPAATAIEGIAANDFYAIMGVIMLELLVIFSLAWYIKLLLVVIVSKPETAHIAKAVIKKSWFWDNFNKAVPIEKEKDLLLDHNYDGIRELDNSLPPWWKYGFYVTIIVSVIYLFRFHVSHDGLSQREEYTVEMQKGEEDKAAYLAQSANNIDENSVTLLTDAAAISEGHELFTKTCAACHLADGGGSVGPNLTDEYWLHGGSIKDIFRSVKYGWQDKGMKSWKDDYSPKQIQELASYIKSLKGTHPAIPKSPQGDIYIEASRDKPAEDSAKANPAKGSIVVKGRK